MIILITRKKTNGTTMELKTRSKDNKEELMANLKLPLKKTTLISAMVSKKGQKE